MVKLVDLRIWKFFGLFYIYARELCSIIKERSNGNRGALEFHFSLLFGVFKWNL